jgi:hypothetical protein
MAQGEPTILLGVGATKAGTTWLYNHLRGHPDCHIRAVKELHYFDTIEEGGWQRQVKVQRRLLAAMEARRSRGAARPGVSARRQGDVRDWIHVLKGRTEDLPGYLAYLTSGRGDRRLAADITPSYALLPEARLRMMAARAGAAAGGVQDAARALLDRVLDGEPSGAVDRGDYAGAIARLRAAVDPTRLLVAFQETVQTAPGLARLCFFLGIRTVATDFDAPVLAGVPAEMTPAQVVRVRAFLAPQYAYVAREIPDLPAAWQRNMVEGVA